MILQLKNNSMKNITKSLLMITAVAALAIGGTVAYFSDTETSTGNTFSTGTISINVNDGEWENQAPYTLQDMKPGYTDYIKFTINNDGSNPANVWKRLSNMITSEIPGLIRGGTASATPVGLDDVIVYDLSVKVYANNDSNSPIWFQTIYTDSDGKTLHDVYGSLNDQDRGVLLGMIPAGGRMDVVQSYHMKDEAENEYQGKTMNFDMKLYAEQLTNTVTMVHKTGGDWDDIDQSLAAKAVLTYKVKDDQFKYDLDVSGFDSGNYVLVSGANPYSGGAYELAAFMTSGGAYNVAGQAVDINDDLTNAKVWVIPATDWSGSGVGTTGHMTDWNGANYLFETALIDYIDPIK